ncbi:hypothetical protein [Rhodococcus sp. OK302]|uniref:hypothetical protein n=1 Tax=Rhodococcus sp. OK302 TaxID=1882769 RepID=UPI0011408899|nr:hypothetical protein [Rhodococcus sp. OK302]
MTASLDSAESARSTEFLDVDGKDFGVGWRGPAAHTANVAVGPDQQITLEAKFIAVEQLAIRNRADTTTPLILAFEKIGREGLPRPIW